MSEASDRRRATIKRRRSVREWWLDLHAWLRFVVSVGGAATVIGGGAFALWNAAYTQGEEAGASSVVHRATPARLDTLEAVIFQPGRLADRVEEAETRLDRVEETHGIRMDSLLTGLTELQCRARVRDGEVSSVELCMRLRGVTLR